jgi:hypothetical protein
MQFKIIKDLILRVKSRLLIGAEKRFVRRNFRFKDDSLIQTDGEILFEICDSASTVIAYSYLIEVLKKKFNARVIAYSLSIFGANSLWIRLMQIVERILFSSRIDSIMHSIGAKAILIIRPDSDQSEKAINEFNQIYEMLRCKRDLENLIVEGIWVGDLIYDTYLRKYSTATVDFNDEKFKVFFLQSLAVINFWHDYFKQHKVKAIIISHCVYHNAIPLRIAVNKKIPVFQVNATHVYHIDDKNLFAYGEYKYYPEIFTRLPHKKQKEGIEEAQRRINLRFSGQVGVDMHYSTKSAYGEKISGRVLRSSNKFKVLIAAHCFFDSPHSYGNNLFPDFYEWFDFLGKVSNETDYDWYIKTHPDFLPGNLEVINDFLCKYPRLTLIDAATSHHQLKEEGIGCALTTYGTIGFEYAALGIPVINASVCNPHIAYDFNLHPKSIKEYHELLLSLESIRLDMDSTKVYEYYFMKNIYNTENWLFEDYQDMLSQLGGYRAQFSPAVYDYYLSHFNKDRHLKVLSSLARFVDSGDFRLGTEHMDEPFQ